MNALAALLAPLALLTPMSGDLPFPGPDTIMAEAGFSPQPEQPQPATGARAPLAAAWLERAHRPAVQNQVRIERRVVIRISPRSPDVGERVLSGAPQGGLPASYAEQELDECIAIDAIAGARPAENNRLLLFMRDRRVLTAVLERTCHPRDFYSGFYLERNEDGKLCTGRDRLQSRTGSSCEVSRLSQLVAIKD